MRPLLLILLLVSHTNAQDPLPRTLTTAAQLRALSAEEAALKHPVRLRAVVTLVAPERTVFLRDETGPTFIAARSQAAAFQPGQLIEVEGVTFPGLYVTGVTAQRVSVVGAAPLPEAIPATYAQLASGRLNYDWVEVRGVVRFFAPGPDGSAVLALAMGDGRLEIHANAAAQEEGAGLVDAAVRVRGLAAGFINDRRQLVAPQMRIADLAAVAIEEAPPDDPWAPAPVPAAHLLRFEPVSAPGRRVKVRGVATHRVEGAALYLRDGDIGLFVETTQPGPAAAGAVVEALGFPEMGRYSAQLRDAVFRVVDSADAPEPTPVTAQALVDGAHDADLVRLEAELLEVLRSAESVLLLLRSGEAPLQARIDAGQGASLVDLRPGSRLRLDGVARVEHADFRVTGFRTRARSLELLLRRAEDVRVLHAPPWWTARRLGIASALLLLAALAALAWVAMLHRRVRAQTTVIGDKLKTEAALEERQRIAREFHDTLEQDLVGLALRLDAAAPKVGDAKPRELLDGARRLVTRIQDEARGFLWNLRDHALEATSLREAIALAVATHGAAPEIVVREEGEPRRLPGRIEHELLRLAQEATANAVRHAAARRITVTLGHTADAVTLTIADDGRGFDPAREGAKPGHFGLTGMQERVKRLGGVFALRTAPGQGTVVEVGLQGPN